MSSVLACIGITEVLGCCRSTWREAVSGAVRVVEILPGHCRRCIGELKRLGSGWRLVDGTSPNRAEVSEPRPDGEPAPAVVEPEDFDSGEIAERVFQRL